MALGRPKTVAIPFPIKGVHRGSPAVAQPEGTTHDLRNVRALHAGDRVGGGKRPGSSKAFTTQLGTAALGRRVTGLGGFTEGAAVPSFTTGGQQAMAHDFTSHGASAAPVAWESPLIGFSNSTANNLHDAGDWSYVSQLHSAGTDVFFALDPTWNRRHFVAPTFATTNDVTIVLAAKPDPDTTAPGIAGSPTLFGPFVRGSNLLTTFFGACLVRRSNTTVRLEIQEATTSTLTTRAQSADLTLVPGATYYADLTIRIRETATGVEATVSWPSQVGTDANWAGVTISYATSDLAGQVRAGMALFRSNGDSSVGPAGVCKLVKSMAYTRLVPTDPVVTNSLLGAQASPGNTHFVPDGWIASSTLAPAANPTRMSTSEAPGYPPDSTWHSTTTPTPTAGGGRWPWVDDSLNVLRHDNTNGNDGYFFQEDNPTTRPGFQFRHLSVKSGSTGYDKMGFVTRVSAAMDAFITIGTLTTSGSGDQNDNETQDDHYTAGFTYGIAGPGSAQDIVRYVYNGAVQFSESLGAATTLDRIIVRLDDWLTFRDDGTTMTISLNGMDLVTYTFNVTHLAAIDAIAGSSKRVGAQCISNSFSASNDFRGFGFRLIAIDVAASVNVADIDSRVVAFTRERAYAGTLDSAVMTELVGQSFDKPLVQSAGFGGKLYAVDGQRAKIINVALGTITDWASEVAALYPGDPLPSTARLVAFYRGAAYLARFGSNPRMWSKSRTLDPLDWRLNLAPLATSSYDGTNGAIGQPSDDITALIPYLDDYLLFGCGTTLWMMEGDPGFRGQIVNLSRQTGVAGARAFCFDHAARLYFLGASGLYRIDSMPGLPQNISGTRLKGLLDRVDLDNTIVQMGYNDFRKEVTIYLTPIDSATAGVHVIYNVDANTFELDEFPPGFGPTAVLSVTGVTDQRRNVIMGGWDGYLRWLDDTQFDDDGEAIEAYFDSAPIQEFGTKVESKATEIQATLFEGSGACTWELFTADSADEVRTKTTDPDETGTWGSLESDGVTANTGFQEPVGLSARGGAHKLRVSQTSAVAGFALEEINLTLEPSSRRH